MNRVKVQSDEKNIHIDCPGCDMWEQLGIDDPRKRLNALPIIEWQPDKKDCNEISTHKCVECDTTFEVEWDYENKL